VFAQLKLKGAMILLLATMGGAVMLAGAGLATAGPYVDPANELVVLAIPDQLPYSPRVCGNVVTWTASINGGIWAKDTDTGLARSPSLLAFGEASLSMRAASLKRGYGSKPTPGASPYPSADTVDNRHALCPECRLLACAVLVFGKAVPETVSKGLLASAGCIVVRLRWPASGTRRRVARSGRLASCGFARRRAQTGVLRQPLGG
jgi:hypothetical protein